MMDRVAEANRNLGELDLANKILTAMNQRAAELKYHETLYRNGFADCMELVALACKEAGGKNAMR